jgi:hypothetical protein
VPLAGNGDILSWEDYEAHRTASPALAGVMLARYVACTWLSLLSETTRRVLTADVGGVGGLQRRADEAVAVPRDQGAAALGHFRHGAL